MPDTKHPLPAVLSYDDVRAVSPALEHYTKDACWADFGNGLSFRLATEAW